MQAILMHHGRHAFRVVEARNGPDFRALHDHATRFAAVREPDEIADLEIHYAFGFPSCERLNSFEYGFVWFW